ncbi:MAG: SLC13 family permease [Pseudomonadota bacterium]|nr:SLC13 family permease [Pseudomonadota bacterium]MEC9392005.1 SLC13 family permease [Pseudomonadota bacterium]MEC9458918.1 SLC13 family permease [Pseudomonadota bacterium]
MKKIISNINYGLLTASILFLILFLSPKPAGLSIEAWYVAAVGVLIAVLWATEAIPLFVTALFPLVFFPLLDISTFSDTATPYANKNIFLFLGGFILALSIQKSNLHERIALNILRFAAKSGPSLIAGFMFVSAFLSMWMMNTSTTLMLLPIGISVAHIINEQNETKEQNSDFAKALLLGIAHAASIGGMATLVGTAPNAIFASFIESNYGIEISFREWMTVGLPVVFFLLPLSWFALTKVVYSTAFSKGNETSLHLQAQYKNLGVMSVAEKRVAIVFSITALSWMLRDLIQLIPFLENLTDHVIAMICAIFLFLIPDGENGKLMDWDTAQKVPWNLLILFGGGLSLANGVATTGLAAWLGNGLEPFGALGITVLIFASVTLIVFLTELTSNIATTSVFLPVIAALAIGLGENPLIFGAAITLAASCAFMLPVATPPNLIVYGSGFISIRSMMISGVVLNIIGIIIIALISVFLIPYVIS